MRSPSLSPAQPLQKRRTSLISGGIKILWPQMNTSKISFPPQTPRPPIWAWLDIASPTVVYHDKRSCCNRGKQQQQQQKALKHINLWEIKLYVPWKIPQQEDFTVHIKNTFPGQESTPRLTFLHSKETQRYRAIHFFGSPQEPRSCWYPQILPFKRSNHIFST